MNQKLTKKEIEKVKELCFTEPSKACAIAQIIADTCQIVSCSSFAYANKKSIRAVQYSSQRLTGISIEGRKFVSIVQ